MEVALALESREHRHEGVDSGHHVEQLVNLDIQQMEVKTDEEVVDTRRLIHTRQFHAGSTAGETNLVEHGNAIIDSYLACQVFQIITKGHVVNKRYN